METKAFGLAAPSIDPLEGKVSGFAAIFGTIDSGGDRILPGAFKKTIQERLVKYGSIPLTWQHVVDDPLGPLGKVTVLREVGRDELPAQILALAPDAKGGLYYEGEITLTEVNKERMKHLTAGSVSGQSIGYLPVQETFVKEGLQRVRNLPELKLFEVASVTIGMMDAAQLTGLKAADTGAWDGAAEVAKADVSDLRAMCAVVDGDGENKSDYHLPHHTAGSGHPVSEAGVKAAAGALSGARGGYQGEGKDKAKTHIAGHYHSLGLGKAPWEADAGKGAGVGLEHKADEAGDASLAQQAVAIVNRLIAAETADLTTDAAEADEIQLLLSIRGALIGFASDEASEAMQTMALHLLTRTKAGRRNSTTDTGMLKAAHDSLHTVLGMPHHELDGSAPAPDEPDTTDADKKAQALLMQRLTIARSGVPLQEVA